MRASTRIPAVSNGSHTARATSGSIGRETSRTTDAENIEGSSQSIIPSDPFDRHSDRCLDGRISNVSRHAEAHGGFSDIYAGDYNGTRVAIKVIRLFDSDGRRRLRREYTSWTWVSHDIVLKCLGFAYRVGPEPYGIPRLISPWMSAGTLNHYMKTRPGLERLKALVDIAEGLAFLHDYLPSIIHGDIRGGNILMSDAGRPCLSDFGLAKVLKEGGMTATRGLIGTIRWMSPELLKDGVVPSAESDVWAYAMTVLEIMSGQIPYADIISVGPVIGMISRGELPTRPGMNINPALSDEIWAVCQKCWIFVPRQRPSMREVSRELSSLLNTPSL
ncbi:kinase-like domain-containing protein [Hysterangium stoloniferum]|nr:kinase-like domain-containing protein [Hysterangium stoloniferum]